jgi:hypothetical protein
MQQLTGRADIYLNGAYAESTQDGSTISTLSGLENTPVVNSRGQVSGFTSKATPAQIKANFTHGPDFDIAQYMGNNVSIDFVCDNGPTYQMASAVFMKDDGLDANKGTVPITFTGTVTNITAGVS